MNKVALVMVLALSATVMSYAQSPAAPATTKPNLTLQEIMLAVIDPNIDPVWNSVATIVTSNGTEERRPKTDQDWKLIKGHALKVLEASDLLLIKGLRVAVEGANTSASGSVELTAPEIQKLIEANRGDYVKRVDGLRDAVQLVITAIDKKDADELVRTGGIVEHACEACHSQFWYPHQKLPSLPAK
jgi:hypothetical protein